MYQNYFFNWPCSLGGTQSEGDDDDSDGDNDDNNKLLVIIIINFFLFLIPAFIVYNFDNGCEAS